jgi:ribonuclease HI
MTDELKKVTIYTDGGCLGNPGRGGYGVVLLYGEHRKELSAGFRLTTNNRMEMMAAIVGLEALRFPCRVTLYTDSEYLIYGAACADRWRRDGWRLNPPKAKKAANRDLWKRLLQARQPHDVEFQWVKGHANVTENERCDLLAMEAAKRGDLQVDEIYEKENPAPRPLPESNYQPPPGSPQRITQEGQPCRKCGSPVEKQIPRRRPKPEQTYYYEYYLSCPGCRTMYMVEDAKRRVE